ncbi:MAG: Hpt domain-containing protein [Pseudomonadales bacterium]
MATLNNRSNPKIDFAIFDEMKFVMEGDFDEFLKAFVADSESRLRQLEEFLERKDSIRMAEVAHSFKGSALNLGAADVARHCYVLESAAKSSTLSSRTGAMKSALADLKQSWASTSSEILKAV